MIVNANSRVQHVTQIKKWNNDKCQRELKNIVHGKKTVAGILAHVFLRIGSI